MSVCTGILQRSRLFWLSRHGTAFLAFPLALSALAFVICAIGGLIPANPAAAQTVGATNPAPTKTNATPQQIQQLIEKLGANQFQEREMASSALLEIGEPALLPLSTAERGRDAEISSRAKAIRERIERERFDAISLSFKRDPDPTASYGLPGWKSFSKVAGTSRPAKRLFLKMLDDRPVVALCLESVEGGQVPDGVFNGLPDDPQLRLRSVVGKACTEIRHSLLRSGQPAETGDLITMLVVVQSLDEPPLEVHDTARLLCNMGALNRMMQMPGAMPSGRKIMGAWFLKVPVVYGSEVLNWANQHRIPEARQMALRMLNSQIEAELMADAFMSLSIFGLPEDLPTIDKFIDNAEVTFEFNATNLPADVQVDAQAPPNKRGQEAPRKLAFRYKQTLGDLALMAACRIAGMELESVFPVVRVAEGSVVIKNTIGFPEDNPAERTDAVKRYKEFRTSATRPAS